MLDRLFFKIYIWRKWDPGNKLIITFKSVLYVKKTYGDYSFLIYFCAFKQIFSPYFFKRKLIIAYFGFYIDVWNPSLKVFMSYPKFCKVIQIIFFGCVLFYSKLRVSVSGQDTNSIIIIFVIIVNLTVWVCLKTDVKMI